MSLSAFLRNGIIVAVFIGLIRAVFATEHFAENRDQLLKIVKQAKPGDIIILADGKWRDAKFKLTLAGQKGAPITIRSETRGKQVFAGESSLDLVGKHVVLDGLTFKDGALDGGHVLKVRGEYCRVTRCSVLDYDPSESETRYHWLSLGGHHHRVDHCRFSGQNHSGVTLVVWLDGEGEVGSHRIDLNHFGPRPRANDNGFETIRIGDSKTSHLNANCMVTQNLFEDCDGEVEIISNKSCQNTYIGNTFVGCAGALTLRHGHRCVVAHNTILGLGEKDTGGIRIVGEDHKIMGNFLDGIGNRLEGAISLSAGVPNAKPNQHDQVKNALIVSNVISNQIGSVFSFDNGLGDKDRSLLPEGIVFHLNQIYGQPMDRVKGKLGDKVGLWDANQVGLEGPPTGPRPHRLKAGDVGPDSEVSGHPDAIANSHPIGKVDDLWKTAFVVPNPESLEGIVVDDAQAELKGDWQYSTHTPPHVGVGYLHDRKSGKGEKAVTYRFQPSQSGTYRVEMSHCCNVRRSTNTPVTIHHSEGERTIRVNQQELPPINDLFRSLGTFRFESGEEAWVRISNEGTDGKYVIADAVRLVLVPEN